MYMRTIAPFALIIVVAANLALGQSLAEVAEKEKERRKNNDKEATVVVKNRGVWLIPEESKPESEDSAEPVADESENTEPRNRGSGIDECRLAQDTLDSLQRDQRVMETRYLQMKRKAQAASILDSHGQRELEPEDWRVPRDQGNAILGEISLLRVGLDNTNSQIDAYLQRLTEDCQ